MKRTIPTMTTTTRLSAHSDSLFLGLSDTAFARILTEAAYSYVLRTGGAHPDAPKSSSIQRAISDYDGSTESEDRIDNAYFTFFVDNPPPPKFLSYAAKLLKEGDIGRDVFRRDRTTLPTQLIKVKNLIPEELADAAMQYVFRTGEGHPDAPDTTDIRKALSANDGSDGATNAIREAYRAAFTRTPPSEAFLRYAEGLVRSNEIVRRKGKPSRFAHVVAARWLAASDDQDVSRWPSYLRLMPPLPPEEGPVAGYDGMVQLLRRLEAGDEVEITYRDSHTGYEATSRRTVSTSWQELKDQHHGGFKRPTVLLQARVKGRFKEGMISDYGDSVQWQPTMSTPVARVLILRKV